MAYLGTMPRDFHWSMIRAAMASPAQTAITPMQDLLGLGSEARMNVPATIRGNWRWRVRWNELRPSIVRQLGAMTDLFSRA